MATSIDLGRSCVDQRAIVVEDSKGTIVIENDTGLNPSQRIFGHEKGGFHRAFVTPKPYSASRGVVTAAGVWEAQGHGFAFENLGPCLIASRREITDL